MFDRLRGGPTRRERFARQSSRTAGRAASTTVTVVKPAGRPARWAGRKAFGLVKGVAKVGLVAGTVAFVLLVLDALLVRDIDRS